MLCGSVNFMLGIACTTIVPITVSCLLFNMTPFWTILLGYWVNGEPLMKIDFVAMIVCFFCVAGIILGKENSSPASDNLVTGVILCIIKSWFFAGHSIATRTVK